MVKEAQGRSEGHTASRYEHHITQSVTISEKGSELEGTLALLGAGFWLKNFTSLHRRIANQLQSCKGATAEHYCLITCLPVMWKLLTGITAEDLYEFLDTENLLPDEQKGCAKNSQGTKDQLYIDEMP